MGWTKRWRKRLRALLRKEAVERELAEELALHLQLETEKNLRSGMSRQEARRQAALAFGGVEKHKEEVRDSRMLGWVPGMSLDFKLGVRMLVKYPGLTLIGGLAMAFAIWVGAGTFEFLSQVVYPKLPLEDGDRIVAIQQWDAAAGGMRQPTIRDLASWREELASIEDLGAFRLFERNLITEGGGSEPIEVAEISASAFRVATATPLLGRPLVEADEDPDAPPVVVIGYRTWQGRFQSDPTVVGRTVGLGRERAVVVGVMPEGFGFPISNSVWVPLAANVLDFDDGQGPEVRVFGRLARGATLGDAQAELNTFGSRAKSAFPDTHEHLNPRVMPYAKSIINLPAFASAGLMSINLFVAMLLGLVASNVALLMFARAATREGEIIVRSALGASRGRIIGQLFAEALVLASLAAVVGLAAAGLGLRWGIGVVEAEMLDGGRVPFWFHASLSPSTVLYAVVLTVLAALIAGVVPALKVTNSLGGRLRAAAPGGGGFRFGGVWTAVIIVQVALTLAFPVGASIAQGEAHQIGTMDVGFAAEEYLSLEMALDLEIAPGAPAESSRAEYLARLGTMYEELEQRLEAEPGVAGVTFADRLPLMYHRHRRIELDEGRAAPVDPNFGYRRVSSASVALDFFEVVDAPILAGRGFHSGDLESEARSVVVNESFVDLVLGSNNPIGRRIRYLYFEELAGPRSENEPWYEIVGVVRDMGMARPWDPKRAGIYHPVAPGGAFPVHVAMQVRGEPDTFVPRLRSIAAAIDPTLRLDEVMPLRKVTAGDLRFLAFWFWLLVLVSSVTLLLSLAGIYSVLSFTVSQRTREIGIRVALGGDARRVAAAIFRRPLAQVGVGILLGGSLAAALRSSYTLEGVALVVGYAAFMMAVCMLAAVVPTRRALQVEPMKAMRVDE